MSLPWLVLTSRCRQPAFVPLPIVTGRAGMSLPRRDNGDTIGKHSANVATPGTTTEEADHVSRNMPAPYLRRRPPAGVAHHACGRRRTVAGLRRGAGANARSGRDDHPRYLWTR